MIVPPEYWYDEDEHEDGLGDETDPGYDGILGEG